MEQTISMLDGYPDTTIVFGDSVFTDFEYLMGKLGAKKVVVFTGRNSADKCGAWKKLLNSFTHVNTAVKRFSDIEPEPNIHTVAKMIEFLAEEQPDEVIGIGGGSAIDAAKLAYLVHQAGGALHDYFGVNKFSEKNPETILKKVICFPTTSGTGTEATPYSNIVDPGLKVKKLVVEPQIIPEYSFICPELTVSMPKSVTLATGCDALAHLLEGLLNVGQDARHPEANNWALQGIRLIVENLPRVIKDGNDHDARSAMAAAACLGGMVIRYKSTGLPHLCSFSWFGRISHGEAVASLLPACWDYYLGNPAVGERTMLLADIFPGETPEEVVAAYCQFVYGLGLPNKLSAYPDLSFELMELTASSAAENKMKLELAPRPVDPAQSKEILSSILHKAYNG
jgi:alcohol dehydrogenase class IV